MKRTLAACTLLVCLSCTLPAADPAPFFFKDGDRIVFLGDSITEQYQYSTDIELYLTTRFPRWKLTFINAGISGDTANGGAGRFDKHVLAEKPTALTVNFGMNDGGYGAFNEDRNKVYRAKTIAMLEMAKKAGVRVGLVSPNAVDRRNKSNGKQYLETQKQFYAPLASIAADYGATYVDQYAVTRAALQKMENDDPMTKTVVPFPDGFHTGSSGGLLMAHAILTGLHAPALVSRVDIDAAASKAQPVQCKVDKLECSPTSVSFVRTDDALPIPVQKDWVTLLPYVNQLKDLNEYGLKITGLSAGKYTVAIDGKEVGTYSDADLSAGVNLGLLTAGPIHEQGQKVFNSINAKNTLVHRRFRDVVMFQPPEWLADVATERKAAELAKRTERIDALQAEIYKMVQPVARRFEVKPAK